MNNFSQFPLTLVIIILCLFALPSAQGFGQSQDNAGSLSLLNDNTLKLTIVGNGYSDQTYVVIVPGSTTGFDAQYDAYKLMGILAAPQLYSIINCCNLSVNALPEIYTNMQVQLGFRVGVTTAYTISAEGLYTFSGNNSVTLEDTKENIFLDLASDSVYTFTGEPTDITERFVLHYNYPARLDVKVLLQGPFNGTDMNVDLNSNNEIPLSQPYNMSPWNYAGTESVASIPESDIVDWLLMEIRDTTDASLADEDTRVTRMAVFLKADGSVVGLDGAALPEFTEPVKNDMFVVIWHRNHLGVISSQPLQSNMGIFSYDFSTSNLQTLGGDQADLGGGKYGIRSGDGNADGTINGSDKISVWQIIVGKKGYLGADYNLNGQVENTDKNELWLVNNGAGSYVP